MKAKLTFTPGALPFIIEALGMSFNEDGYLIDKDRNILLSTDNIKVTKKNIVGIYKKKIYTSVWSLLGF